MLTHINETLHWIPMKLLFKDFRKGEVRLKIENKEDLWYLSQVIESSDFVSGKTERKLKIGEEPNIKVVRKWVSMEIRVEKVEFSKTTGMLRVLGTIIHGPEDVPRGAHHSFNLEEGSEITLKKEEFLGYHIEKLKQAQESDTSRILVVIFDREDALFYLLRNQGHELLLSISGSVAKKDQEGQASGNFYKEIAKKILDYKERLQTTQIIAASPGFWKEYLVKELDDELQKKVTFAACSGVDEKAIEEVVKRPELKVVLDKDRNSREITFIDELLAAIAKDKATYGFNEVLEKINEGNVKTLFVSDNYLQKCREENSYTNLEALMKNAEKVNGTVHILSNEDAMKKLDGLSGIGLVLRW